MPFRAFISLALSLSQSLVHSFIRSFVRSFDSTIAFTFQIEVVRTQIDNVTVFNVIQCVCSTLISVESEAIWIVAQAF